MIGDNEVKDSRGERLPSEISLYEVYRVDTRTPFNHIVTVIGTVMSMDIPTNSQLLDTPCTMR
jgi:hypothetical protein